MMLLNKLISKNVSTSYCLKKPGAKSFVCCVAAKFYYFWAH